MLNTAYKHTKSKLSYILFIICIILSLSFPKYLNAISDPISTWTPTSQLEYALASHISFIYNNNIFIVGGATTPVYDNIIYSPIDNLLFDWRYDDYEYVKPVYWHNYAIKDKIIYILGGANYTSSYTPYADVYYDDLSENAFNWLPTSFLFEPLQLGGSVIVGDYIYYAGGFSNNIEDVKDNVYYAPINVTGSLGAWISTTHLPQPLYGHGMVETGNKIIIIGGTNLSQTIVDTVYEADILPGGSLGPWVNKTGIGEKLPIPLSRAGVVKIGNYVIVVGGITSNGTATSNVYYAPILENGSLGTWTQSEHSLPLPRCCGSLAASDTHLYYTGGHDGVNYFNTVYYAAINANGGSNLEVDNIKQTTSPWGPKTYDFADNWYPSNPSISRWGCAMTSAAMILNYYGDNTDPEKLNDWLKANNGYTRNGGVLWPTISRYSLQDPDTPTLKFSYHNYSDILAKGEIDSNRPSILKLDNEPYGGNHFVVSKGYSGSEIYINDPASNANTTLSQANSFWGNTLKLGKFAPSETDLSYIALFVDDGFEIKVSSDSGQISGEEFYFKEYPMLNPLNPSEQSGVEALNAFYYPKPETGIYNVEILGEGNYQLDAYLYDEAGNVLPLTFEGSLDNNEPAKFPIKFYSEVNFKNISANLEYMYENGMIKNKGVYTSITKLIQNANKNIGRGDKLAPKVLLNVALKRIQIATPKYIDVQTSNYLQKQVEILLSTL